MADTEFDVIIIGSGPGGYVAAIRAAQLGLKTAVVERSHLGGICLNWGCIPTKALLKSAELLDHFAEAERFGLRADNVRFDTEDVVAYSRKAAAQLSKGVDGLLKKNKIPVIWGSARITAPGKVAVSAVDSQPPRGAKGPGDYSAKHIIVATGARPRALPGLEPDGNRVWSYFEALAPSEMPASLAVIGSGAIGTEFASFYRSMGADVTLIEAAPQILPVEDQEIAAIVRKDFTKRGIAIRENTKVAGARLTDSGVELALATAEETDTFTADKVIVAIGIEGISDEIGLGDLCVAIERGVIVTDGHGRTNVEGIYAIGDVAGPPMLAHKAEHEGVVCIEAIAGLDPSSIERSMIPACTYCRPQVASIGMTERQAVEAGIEVRVGKFPLIGNGKAVVIGETGGLVKTIFEASSGKLVGAHLVGPGVTELIQGFAIAMAAGATDEILGHTVFPHPTLSEAMHESVLSSMGRVIHI